MLYGGCVEGAIGLMHRHPAAVLLQMYACQADKVDLAAMKFNEDMGEQGNWQCSAWGCAGTRV